LSLEAVRFSFACMKPRFSILLLVLSLLLLTVVHAQNTVEPSLAGIAFPTELQNLVLSAPSRVYDSKGVLLEESQVLVKKNWTGKERCNLSITNVGSTPVSLGNIVLFDLKRHQLPPETPIYGEGFQMLSQTEGTVAAPRDLAYKDRAHYKIPEPDGLRTVYGMMTFDFSPNGHVVLAFSSCKRFIGRFSFDAQRLRISVDPENLELEPGESWDLEEFMILTGADRSALLAHLADRICELHPPLPLKTVPTGWCSWYCYGAGGTQKIIHDNMMEFKKKLPVLKYIQIDDGYSPTEGDWLDANPQYGDIRESLADITKSGFSPAIWVAPFIAEKKSRILAEHPGWFIQNTNHQPFDSSTVGFGGWRHDPWFVLDGTNPETQGYLKKLFQTMRKEWNVAYFKLDANYWGAVHSCKFHDRKATRVEAYRRGMQAVIEGAGPDAVILGCNAPIWPSFGLVNAMRTSNDIERSWDSFSSTGRENLNRVWLNGRQWASDPDCVLLTDANLPPHAWQFHATIAHAVDGLILSGDKAASLSPEKINVLKKLLNHKGKTVQFENSHYELGTMDCGMRQFHYLFNWSKTPADRTIHLKEKSHLIDYWTDQDLGVQEGNYVVRSLPGQSAMLIMSTPAK